MSKTGQPGGGTVSTDLELVTRWFQKAIDTATKQGRHESALLWSDGLNHLIALSDRAEKLEEAIREHWQESTHGATANMRHADEKLHALILEPAPPKEETHG